MTDRAISDAQPRSKTPAKEFNLENMRRERSYRWCDSFHRDLVSSRCIKLSFPPPECIEWLTRFSVPLFPTTQRSLFHHLFRRSSYVKMQRYPISCCFVRMAHSIHVSGSERKDLEPNSPQRHIQFRGVPLHIHSRHVASPQNLGAHLQLFSSRPGSSQRTPRAQRREERSEIWPV